MKPLKLLKATFKARMQRLLESKLEQGDVQMADPSASTAQEACESSGLHILAEDAKIRFGAQSYCNNRREMSRSLVWTRIHSFNILF